MAEGISSGRIVKKPAITIDPNFLLPPGLIDVTQRDVETEELEYDGEEVTESNEEVVDAGYVDPDHLETTQTFLVVNETVRVLPDGSSVVDLIVELDDIPGITNYEARVTKV